MCDVGQCLEVILTVRVWFCRHSETSVSRLDSTVTLDSVDVDLTTSPGMLLAVNNYIRLETF